MKSEVSIPIVGVSSVARIPPGIRCVIAMRDPEQRAAILSELRDYASVIVVGLAEAWDDCRNLVDQYLPEILIIERALAPRSFPDEDSVWPLVLSIGASPSDDRILNIPDREKFSDALEVLIQRVVWAKANELRELMKNYVSAVRNQPLTAFTVIDEGRECTIPSEEVRFITVDGNYAKLHTAAGQFRVRETLNNLASSLDGDRFARIHRSIIVNLSFVDRVLTTADRASLILRDRTHLPIGPSFSIPSSLAG